MYQPYLDIIEKLGAPKWWDENGVPRYEDFEPRLCADIYAKYAALIEIECQGCEKHLAVSASWSLLRNVKDIAWDENGKNGQPKEGLPKQGDAGCFGYGDAPWHGHNGDFNNQCGGTTMTTSTVRILQCWKRDAFDWLRMPEHEIYVGEDFR
jgi:hypothetical protein